jgi:uncharacterized protein (DUF58 family)
MSLFRSPVVGIGIGTGLVLLVVAILAGRVDVAIGGLVLLVAVALSARRPEAAPRARLVVRSDDGTPDTARVRVELDLAEGTDLAQLRLRVLGSELRRLTVAGDGDAVTVEVPIVHTGPQELVDLELRAASADAAWIGVATTVAPARATIEPRVQEVPFLPLPARLRGLTGGHESSRPGDGGEFRDVHPFTPGDRLRRIDWRATARLGRSPGDLYVRRTQATSDARVSLVLDDAVEVGARVADWQSGDVRVTGETSLDVARDAAWSLSSGYLAAGDSVSFQVLSRARGTVPSGSGARHGQRLRPAIARVTAEPRGFARARTPLVAPGALVVLLSTYLDDDPARLALLWRASGHRVIAVDVLPAPDTAGLTREQRLALRVVLGRRSDRLTELRGAGVDVLAWDVPVAERRAALAALARPKRRGAA